MAAPARHGAHKRSPGLRVLGLLGKVLALGGTVALAFQFGARGLAAGLLFGFALPWLVALRPKVAPRRNPFKKGVRHLRWWPQFRLWALISGVIAGLGTVITLQQYSIQAMTSALLVKGLVGGVLGGVIIPSITWAFAVRRFNARMRAAPGTAPGVAATTVTQTLGVLTVVAWVFLLVGGAAWAEVTAPCSAAFGGTSVDDLDSRDTGDAISVGPDSRVRFALAGPAEVVSSEFDLDYGPLSVPIDSHPGTGNAVFAEANVADHTWMGAGLYRVTGSATFADGSSCTGAVLVDVQGEPLDSVAGAFGATALAAGVLGVAGASLRDVRDTGKSYRLATQPPPAEDAPWPLSTGGDRDAEAAGAGAGVAGAMAAGAAMRREDQEAEAGGEIVSAVPGTQGSAGGAPGQGTTDGAGDAGGSGGTERMPPGGESGADSVTGAHGPFGVPEEIAEKVLDPESFEEGLLLSPDDRDEKERELPPETVDDGPADPTP